MSDHCTGICPDHCTCYHNDEQCCHCGKYKKPAKETK